MILSATLSKPTSLVEERLGKPYEKIKIRFQNSSTGASYYSEMFTKTQVFHRHFSTEELNQFLQENAGITFKSCVKRTETEEITILANKKGKISELHRKISGDSPLKKQNQDYSKLKILPSPQKKKNYLLEEGHPVPFMVLLGIMTPEGKVVSSRYDKFRQINRFLEFIDDILPQLLEEKTSEEPVRIVDFGCGKSYLTFAVHYFISEIKGIKCQIEGLDLKEEVIAYCNEITAKLKLENLIFHTGNISDYSGEKSPDLIITLHACDTATDYALKYAVSKNTKAILSVPCCQHEINQQLKEIKNEDFEKDDINLFEPLLKWGYIREKFSSLLTDALRGEWLEQQGYNVQMLEFIDEDHTPKNLMIRAVKKTGKHKEKKTPSVLEALKISPLIYK